jgi:hypothetical protein
LAKGGGKEARWKEKRKGQNKQKKATNQKQLQLMVIGGRGHRARVRKPYYQKKNFGQGAIIFSRK